MRRWALPARGLVVVVHVEDAVVGPVNLGLPALGMRTDVREDEVNGKSS